MIVKQRKLAFIDAMRGMAVLLIILPHILLPEELKPLAIIGSYGVQLFFVISAFTLFLSMDAKSKVESRPVLYFFIRRFFRIAPAFYLAAAFYLLKDGLNPTFWAPYGIELWQIIATLFFMHGWHPETLNSVVPGGWSIAVEMAFYLFVPVSFSYIRNKYHAALLALILMIIGLAIRKLLFPIIVSAYPEHAGALASYFMQLWFPSQACVFPFGFILYFLFRDNKGEVNQRDKPLAFVMIVVAIYLFISFTSGAFRIFQPQFLYSMAFVLFGYGLALYPFKIFVNTILCQIGKISFSVYLFHFWIISVLKLHLDPLLAGANPYFGALVFYFATVFLALLVATITYKFIEKPGQNLGRRIIDRLEARCGKEKSNLL